MDPVTISGCVALATGSFKAIKGAVSAGRDLSDIAGQLNQWGKACSDLQNFNGEKMTLPSGKRRSQVATRSQLFYFGIMSVNSRKCARA